MSIDRWYAVSHTTEELSWEIISKLSSLPIKPNELSVL